MARWDPGTEQRLRKAALELFREHGYDNVTVTHIAERAGITRRSYFRYFSDKREVLFANSDRLPAAVGEAVLAADKDTPPLAAVLDALAEVGVYLTEHGDDAAQRREVINSSPELRERERTKLAALSAAIGQALRQRGLCPDLATSTAQLATIAFANAYGRWVRANRQETFTDCLASAIAALRGALGRVAWPTTTAEPGGTAAHDPDPPC
ncbi:TetR/AcrR family transcriptional regulator [Streptomyces sp. MUM 16J]|uniref:TetR/AcrR family transcriptional regulator n=1 Tax=Streptomyces sp. MUM 16J TaxID=2791988 RepID=UPI0007C6C157|nr:TetR/AcrR family transcriptional regulator [Streptomyces sp. MUM 16J]MCH0558435.1 TetR family transcriptional regulator [Streptomyces sp. MUM 16J]